MVRGAHNFWDWRGLAWLIEVRGPANRSEGLANRSEGLEGRAGPGPVDKSEGFLSIKVRDWGAGLAQALSIKVRAWGAGPAQGPVDKSEGLGGRAGPGPKNCEPPRWFATVLLAHCQVLIAKS